MLGQLTNQVEITPVLRFWLWRPILTTNTSDSVPRYINQFKIELQIFYAASTTKKQDFVFALLPREQSFVFNLHDALEKLFQNPNLYK